MISLIFINFLIDLQVTGFTKKYSELLKKMTVFKDNKKELENLCFIQFVMELFYPLFISFFI